MPEKKVLRGDYACENTRVLTRIFLLIVPLFNGVLQHLPKHPLVCPDLTGEDAGTDYVEPRLQVLAHRHARFRPLVFPAPIYEVLGCYPENIGETVGEVN